MTANGRLRSPWLAAGTWAGAAAGWVLPWSSVIVLVGVVGVAAAAVALRRGPCLAVCVLVVTAAATIVAALGSDVRHPPDEAIDRVVGVSAQVRGPGKAVAGSLGRPPAVAVPVTVRSIVRGGTTLAVDLPVRLFVAADDWPAEAVVGALVSGRVRLQDRGATSVEPVGQALTPPVVIAAPGPLAAVGDSLRRGLAAATGPDPADAAALVAGIAIDDESRQTAEFADAMRLAGLSHLTAVSGGNFAIVMTGALLILRTARRSVRLQVTGCAVVVVAYGALVGAQPSVLRAAAMAGVGLVGVLLGGPARGLPLLGGCVAALLLMSPELAWSLGFALSVAATAGLQVVAPLLLRHIPSVIPRPVALPLAVAVAAHAVTAPLLAIVGAPVSWVTVPANVVVGGCVAPVTILGLLAAVLSPVSSTAAAVAGHVALPFAQVIVVVAGAARSLALSGMVGAMGPALLMTAVAVGLWLWCVRRRAVRSGVVAAAAALIVGGVVLHHRSGPAGWRVAVCDVGQGTAVLARTGPASAAMFDTGPEDGDAAACATRMGVRSLDAVVLSHFHADHVGGLGEVVAAYPGTPVVATVFRRPRTMVDAVTGESGAPGAAVAGAAADWTDVRATALWPPSSFSGSDDAANNSSVVAALRWDDGFTALLPGDIEPESQRSLMAAAAEESHDVVVIPHHGSDHQDSRFAAWTHPGVAVASVGAGNTYGHPAAQTVAEYQSAGALVWRTDLDGCAAIGGTAGEPWVAPC